jgi:hypothetical protein
MVGPTNAKAGPKFSKILPCPSKTKIRAESTLAGNIGRFGKSIVLRGQGQGMYLLFPKVLDYAQSACLRDNILKSLLRPFDFTIWTRENYENLAG